jgi:hypothetical protein
VRSRLAALWQLRRTIAAFGLIAFGCYHTYLAIAFHAPQRITFDAFEREMPKVGWFEITGVPLDYDRAVFDRERAGVDARYIPAVDARGKIPLLVNAYFDDEPRPLRGRATKTISGTLEVWLDGGASDRPSDVAPLATDLFENYRTIRENDKPNLATGLLLGFIGLALGGLLLLGAIGGAAERRKRTRAHNERARKAQPPTTA